nr:Ig-like domain-containing protein [Eubacterium sp.]
MKGKKILGLFLAMILTVALVIDAPTAEMAKKVKVSSVKVTNAKKKLRIQKGKTLRLKTKVKVSPNKAKYRKVKYKSSNPAIVSVNSKGVLKAKKKGSVKITVSSKTKPSKKAKIRVTVTEEVLVKSITLDKTSLTINEASEDDYKLTVTKILPSNAKNKEIEWETDDEDVCDVDGTGELIIGDPGEAEITAWAADDGGAVAVCKVTITEDESDEDDDGEDDSEEVDEDNAPEDTDESEDEINYD